MGDICVLISSLKERLVGIVNSADSYHFVTNFLLKIDPHVTLYFHFHQALRSERYIL